MSAPPLSSLGPHCSLGPHPDFPRCEVRYALRGSFGWVEPAPSADDLATFYREQYRSHGLQRSRTQYAQFMRQRAETQRRFIVRHGAFQLGAAMLDIGCGAGFLLRACSAYAGPLVGFETDVAMAAWARDQLGSRATILAEHFVPTISPLRGFDLVCLSHVLEHVPQPESFLTDLRSWLAVGGRVFIEVPNDPFNCVRLQVKHGFRGLAHVDFFTIESLIQVATASGYRVAKAATFGASVYATWRARFAAPTGTPRWRNLVLRATSARQSGWQSVSPLRTEHPRHGTHIRAILQQVAQ